MDENEHIGPIPWVVDFIDRFLRIETFNAIVFVVVVLLVILARGQVILFKLERFRGVYDKQKPGVKWLVGKDPVHPGFKVVAYLGMGAAFYALFVSHVHFAVGSWLGLVMSILGIMVVGFLWEWKKKEPPPPVKLKSGTVVSWEPDPQKSWCMTCKAHTRVLKSGAKQGSCANCRGTHYSLFTPVHTRNAGYGCGGCAAIPAVFGLLCLLGVFGNRVALGGSLLGAFLCLVVIGFPLWFFYQYRLWKKWSVSTGRLTGEPQISGDKNADKASKELTQKVSADQQDVD